MKRERVPKRNADFVDYVMTGDTYLHKTESGSTDPRGKILGMTTQELTVYADFAAKLVSGDHLNPGIWDLHSNKETRTQVTSAMLRKTKKEFNKFFRPLLNRMNTSTALNENDRIALRLSDPVESRKKPSLRIPETCFVNVTILGHGQLKFECRKNNDGKRSGRPVDANAVEGAYCKLVPDTTDAEQSGSSESTPASTKFPQPDTIHNRIISTKAGFMLSLDESYVGESVLLWFRWINTMHPELAGNWSAVVSVVVS
jgi:hypothetical protein